MPSSSPAQTTFHVYILVCSDGSYYVGHTEDLQRRLRAHDDGRGSVYTARRRPVRLVHSEPHPDKAAAVKRERQVKRWSRAKKQALAAGEIELLQSLSRANRTQSGRVVAMRGAPDRPGGHAPRR